MGAPRCFGSLPWTEIAQAEPLSSSSFVIRPVPVPAVGAPTASRARGSLRTCSDTHTSLSRAERDTYRGKRREAELERALVERGGADGQESNMVRRCGWAVGEHLHLSDVIYLTCTVSASAAARARTSRGSPAVDGAAGAGAGPLARCCSRWPPSFAAKDSPGTSQTTRLLSFIRQRSLLRVGLSTKKRTTKNAGPSWPG